MWLRLNEQQSALSRGALGRVGDYRVTWVGKWESKPVHHAPTAKASCASAVKSARTSLGFATVEEAVEAGHVPCKRCRIVGASAGGSAVVTSGGEP